MYICTFYTAHEKEPKLSIDMGLPLPTAQSKAYKANSLLLTLPWVRENDILQASSPGNYMLLYPSASPSQMKDGEEKVETDANSDAASGSSPGSSFSPETDSDSTFNSQEHRTIDDDIIYNHLMIDMHHREVEARLTDEMLQGLDLREHANEEESLVLSQISIFSIKDKKVCGYKANIASSGKQKKASSQCIVYINDLVSASCLSL